MGVEPVPPYKVQLTRYTKRYCGRCFERIKFGDKKCKYCGTPINWDEYGKGKE